MIFTRIARLKNNVNNHHVQSINDLQFIHGQVEGDAAGHGVPVLEVSEEADPDVEAGDEDHAGVEDAVPASHVTGGPHLVLKGEHHTDSLLVTNNTKILGNFYPLPHLEGIDSSSEVERQLAP